MIEFFQSWGYLGLFLGSFLASTVVPFSADALIIGMLVVGGRPWLCFLLATIGNWLGGMTSFAIGWIGKWEWIEKYLKVKRETLEKQKSKVDRFGPFLAFLAWLPVVGDVFAIALGFYKTKPVQCSIYMLLGRAARFLVWLYIIPLFK